MIVKKGSRLGFTLIELLVVIAIIAILIALLVPAVQKVRAAAAGTQCQNNIKQLVLGCHAFEDAYKRFPMVGDPVCGEGLTSNAPNSSYLVPILPYVEQQAVFDNIAMGNDAFVLKPIQVFCCPMETRGFGTTDFGDTWASTSYVGITGWAYDSTASNKIGVFNQGDMTQNQPTSLIVTPVTIADGTSNTIMIAERPISCDLFWGWWSYNVGYDAVSGSRNAYELSSGTEGGPGCNPQPPGNCGGGPYFYGDGPRTTQSPCSMNNLWSLHISGGYFGFADGSVRSIEYNANQQIVVELSTIAGNETIPADY